MGNRGTYLLDFQGGRHLYRVFAKAQIAHLLNDAVALRPVRTQPAL